MAVESAADRLDMLDSDEFGVAFTWTKANGVQAVLSGIFDAAFAAPLEGSLAGPGGVESTGPRLLVRSADVSGIAHGQAIEIGDDDYTVAGVEPDGTGLTAILLEAA